MPNRSVPGWTQVPVVAADMVRITYDRLNAAGTSCQLTVAYEIKDNLGALRQSLLHTQQVGAYPVTLAAILAAINTAQGT